MKHLYILVLLYCSIQVFSQDDASFPPDTMLLEFDALLNMASQRSYQALASEQQLALKSLDYDIYRASRKPNLIANIQAPNLQRSLVSIIDPDGRDIYANRSSLSTGVGFNLVYDLEKSGGSLYFGSNITRLDVFASESQDRDYSRVYYYNPITLSYSQPLFRFNELRYRRQTVELEYAISQFQTVEERISVAVGAAQYFFELFIIYKEIEIKESRFQDLLSLLQIKQRLQALGQTSLSEIMELELEMTNLKTDIQQRSTEVTIISLQIADLLNMDRKMIFRAESIPSPRISSINIELANEQALNNRLRSTEIQRTIYLLEMEKERTAKNTGLSADLQLQLGFNNTTNDLSDLHRGLLDKQVAAFSLSLPIVDWNYSKLSNQRAQLSLKIGKENIDQQNRLISQRIIILVSEYHQLLHQWEQDKQARKVTQEIYEIKKRQYAQGDLSITDLNIIANNNEIKNILYAQRQAAIWQKYLEIQLVTLYDFEKNQSLFESMDNE